MTDSAASQANSSDDWQMLQVAALQELARRTKNSLVNWALAYRFFNGRPMRLTPAFEDLYADTHPFIVIQKAAQVFVSEFLINTAFWVADTGQGDRGNALFLMPTGSQVDDFSQARIDKAISESPYLVARLFPPPPGRPGPTRQNLKKVGLGYVYLRGSESRRQLTSVDADAVLLDEYDLMTEGVLDLAQKRLASSTLGWMRVASTPRYPEAGINSLFLQSDRRYYFLPCPSCGRNQKLEWASNVDVARCLIVCSDSRCRTPLDLWARGQWEAEAPGNDIRGYHINRLYSPRANVRQMVRDSEASTPSALQEFHNSVLGETFIPPGGRLTLDVLDRCRRDYEMGDGAQRETYMGVDVGFKLYVIVREPIDGDKTRSAFVGTVDSFEDLDALMSRFRVKLCVIDALPDTHKAQEFARKHRTVWRAFYIASGDHEWHRAGRGENKVSINRTQALDQMFDDIQHQRSELPRNARSLGGGVQDGLGEYYRQMLALTRRLDQNALGNWRATYDEHGKADHFAHAEVYCRLAEATYSRHSTRIELAFPSQRMRSRAPHRLPRLL